MVLRDLEITDIHTHGIAGSSTKTSSPEEILRISKIHFSYGVKNLLLSIYPGPIPQMRKNMEAVKMAMEMQSDISASKESARILGLHLEGPFLNKKRSGALNKEFFLNPDEKLLEELIEGFEEIIRVVTVAPELEKAPAIIRKLSKKGILVSMGHSEATYSEAEEGYRSGALCITHIFNAMRGIHHREVGIAGFGLLKRDVYVEIIGDLEHLNVQTMELLFRIKDEKHIILISDSYKETLTLDRNLKKDSRLKGGLYPLTICAQKLIQAGFNEDFVIALITENPMRFLSCNSF